MKMRILALTLALMFATHAHAWGNDGHRIIGHIATALLTDSARQKLRELSGNDDLAAIATVLDDEREQFEQSHPGASRWHYENREVCDASVSCPQNQCITRQIEHHLRILRDRRSSKTQRVEAITVLVHLLGDLHQPLHLTDNHDRGGNDVLVQLPRNLELPRLHEAWDTSFVRMNMQRRSPERYARSLQKEFAPKIASWQHGDVQSWANETFAIGKQFAYQSLPGFSCAANAHANATFALPTSYVRDSRKIVAEQLAKAGARIAAVLNDALK